MSLFDALAADQPSSRQWRPQTGDPNDEMVLEAAINGRANAVLTYNTADFASAAKRFKISVLSPADLLKKVRA